MFEKPIIVISRGRKLEFFYRQTLNFSIKYTIFYLYRKLLLCPRIECLIINYMLFVRPTLLLYFGNVPIIECFIKCKKAYTYKFWLLHIFVRVAIGTSLYSFFKLYCETTYIFSRKEIFLCLRKKKKKEQKESYKKIKVSQF